MLGFNKLLHVKEFLNYLNSFRGFFKTAIFAVVRVNNNCQTTLNPQPNEMVFARRKGAPSTRMI